MKVTGVIIDSESRGDVEKLGCTWSAPEDGPEDFDLFQDIIFNRTEALEKINPRFMCGEDDGKVFFFSDNAEVATIAIVKVFPEFDLVEVELDDYALDYDYHRDGI